MTKSAPKPDKAADDAILALARERFLLAVAAEDKRRERQLHDYKFSLGRKNHVESYQYNEEDRSLRLGRAMLTVNRIGPHCRQLANQIHEANQGIKVLPIDSGADPDKAEVLQGVIRLIESRSQAPYLLPTDHQLRMGEGFVRVVPRFVGGVGPEQDLFLEGVRNRFSVYGDPAAKELTGSDWDWLFITDDLLKATYDKKWPETTAASLTSFDSYGNEAATWFVGGHVRIAEYFCVETVYEAGEIRSRKVHWYKMNGIEILDRRTLPIPMIPVVRIVGEVRDLEGEVDYVGVVPDAMDAQKMLNYAQSQTAEAFAIAPKAAYVGYAASFTGRPEWDSANTRNWSKLQANTVDPDNRQLGMLPLPQRNLVSPDLTAMVLASQQAENNLRAELGVVDVDSNERAKEQSGRAIKARQMQSDLSNSHFAKNKGLAVRQVGRVCYAWAPFIYDAPRVMEIVGADDKRKTVMVHAGAEMAPQATGMVVPEGMKVYDLRVGRYDIEISDGPSTQTRRQEAVEMMTQVITAEPELLKTMGDLYFGNMDWPEARQIGERFKKLLPPELQDKEPGAAEIPPEVQQQMAEAQKQIELMAQQLEALTQENNQQKAKAQADLQAKQAAIQSDENQKLAEIESEEKIAAAKLEQEYRLSVLKMEHEWRLAHLKAQQVAQQVAAQAEEGDKDRAHEAESHDVDLRVQREESHASREHELTMAEREAKAERANGAKG